MNKVKVRILTVISLIALLIVTFALAIGSVFPAKFARAVTPVEYTPGAVFTAGVGGSVGASEAGEGETSYIEFSISDGGSVQFRRDLALRWFSAPVEGEDTSASSAAKPGIERYFEMVFSFLSVDFETFTLEFSSDEENISKEGQAVNSLVFTKNADGSLTVVAKNASEQELENNDETLDPFTFPANVVTGDFTLRFGAATDENAVAGDYAVTLACGTHSYTSKFTNIGGNFMEYRSNAATSPNMPMTFTADLPAGAEEGATQSVLMKSLNGQSFELTEDGMVEDNTAPVLVLNEEVYAFTLGRRFSLSYEAIDVCDDTVSVTRSYYMAVQGEDGSYISPDASDEDDYDYSTLTTSTYFMPVTDGDVEYVSIYFNLDDGRTRSDEEREAERVYLAWYAAESDNSDEESAIVRNLNGCDYIRVDRNEVGPAYIGLEPVENAVIDGETRNANVATDASAYENAVSAYQRALDDAAAATSAGSGAYLYLPSLRGLIYSDYADYRNLEFTVFYYSETQSADSTSSSASGLDYNDLRIEVDESGTYRIRIIATDASSNGMEYYNEDGELVTLSSSNVWDIEGIPEFYVEIGYTGASIEDPGAQDYGYRDRTYSIEDFEVIALDGYIEDYTLYYFNPALLADGQDQPESYDDWVANAADYVTDTYKDCMVVINPYNDEVTEDDENWDDTDNAYQWDPESSLSFVPQRSGIYVVELLVTDPNLSGMTATQYMAIEVRNPVDIIPGQSQWLQNNILSVVLFSISAVLAVIIVILFVVKPSDKNVKEVDLEKLKGKKKNDKK